MNKLQFNEGYFLTQPPTNQIRNNATQKKFEELIFVFYFTESLSLITILSAVIGGVILTVAAILIMILCRRSSALTLKAMNNGDKPTR